jgi:hypothetical protein
MAEFWRALRTLKALQAEQTAMALGAVTPRRPETAGRPPPNEPERRAQRRLEYVLPDQPTSGRALHEPVPPVPRCPEIKRTRQPRQYWRISPTRRAREPKPRAARSHPNFIDVVAAHIRRTRQ